MTSPRTIHPATGRTVDVVAVDCFAPFDGVSTLVTYHDRLPGGSEFIGVFTLPAGVMPELIDGDQ